jgi:hypothetical protein
MNDLIQRVVNAIIRQEGMPGDYPNPGNLRGAPWLAGAIVDAFWRPPTRQIGVAGLAHLVALHIAQGNTLTDFIAGHPLVYGGFATGSDHNKPDVYIANVANWAIIPSTTLPLWNYIETSAPETQSPAPAL